MLPNENTDSTNPAGNPTPADGEAGEETKPHFVTAEQLTPLTRSIEAIQDTLRLLAQQRQEPVGSTAKAPEVIAEPTDDEIVSELREGKIGKLRQLVKATESRIRREEVEPIRAEGMVLIDALSKAVVENSKSLNMPYWDQYKNEIEEILKTVSPQQRAHPTGIKYAYDLVVGRHVKEIAKLEVDKAIASQRERGGDILPGGSAGREISPGGGGGKGRHTVETLFGPELAESLKNMGRTPDQHARAMGFKSFDDYGDFVVQQREGEAAKA